MALGDGHSSQHREVGTLQRLSTTYNRALHRASRSTPEPAWTLRRGMVQPNALLPGLAIRVEAGRATRRMGGTSQWA